MVGKKTRNDMASCSILPGIFGISPYENSSRAMVLSRCIRAKNGEDVMGEQNPQMFMGDLLENTLLNHAVKTIGLVMPDFDVDYAIKHPELPLEGSMDAIAFAGEKLRVNHEPDKGVYIMGSNIAEMSGEVVLECKVTRDFPEEEPPQWRGTLQLQGLMDIKGAQWGVLCVLYQSTTFKIFIYHRNEVIVKSIHELVKDFDRRIQEEDYYPPISPDEALTVWGKTNEDSKPVKLKDAAKDEIDLIELSTDKLKKWEKRKKEATANLMAMLEDSEYGYYQDDKTEYEVTWPTRHFSAKEERVIPAKESYSIRQKTLKIRKVNYD